MTVLVVGATGQQGGAVVTHLLSDEYGEFDVHALTRTPDSEHARALADRGATIVKGDLLNKASLTPAVEANDAVFFVTTPQEGIDGEIEQGTNMAEVAATTGIEHVVFSSSVGVERDTGISVYESKYAIEQRIRNIECPATIVRPVSFMQNFEQQREAILDGTLASPIAEGHPWQLVDVDDIGMLVATAFANPEEYADETIELASDELTLEEAAEIFTDVTGTTVKARHLPTDVVRERMGDAAAMTSEWINDHGYAGDVETLKHDRDLDLTKLETYLHTHGWAESQ